MPESPETLVFSPGEAFEAFASRELDAMGDVKSRDVHESMSEIKDELAQIKGMLQTLIADQGSGEGIV